MYSVIYPQVHWSEESRKEIESNAYFKWVDAGRPHGQDKHFWDLAEQEQIKKRFLPPVEQTDELIELNYHAPGQKPKRWSSSSTYLDAGYFYCPYIPLQKTPVVMPVYQEDTDAKYS